MAKLLQVFDARQHNPQQSAGQLPVGKHIVCIVEDEVKATKKGDGGYLQLGLRVVNGPNTGATGPYRLNLYSNSQQAVEIANNQLSAICHCVNVFNINDDVRVIHNLPFMVEVSPQADSQYTQITKVFDANGNEPGKAPTNQPQFSPQTQPQNQQLGNGGSPNPIDNLPNNPSGQQFDPNAWGHQRGPDYSQNNQPHTMQASPSPSAGPNWGNNLPQNQNAFGQQSPDQHQPQTGGWNPNQQAQNNPPSWGNR